MLDAKQERLIVNMRSLVARYAESCGRGAGEDVAQDWVECLLRRLNGEGKDHALKFLHAAEAQINQGELPSCLKAEARKRVRRQLKRKTISLENAGLIVARESRSHEIDGETPVEKLVTTLSGSQERALRCIGSARTGILPSRE